MDNIHPKRKYDSSRRKAQARQTRRQILEAARKLFYERGYSGATIDAIAQQAGVALETVYAAFGNKQAILINLINITVVGDDEPVPLLQRAFILDASKIHDQGQLLRKFAEDIFEIMTRMSPVFALVRAAAKTDPEIDTIQRKMLAGRLEGVTFLVDQLIRIGPLRPEVAPSQAADTVWLISSAEVFHLLTVDRSWPKEHYIAWIVDALSRLLLP